MADRADLAAMTSMAMRGAGLARMKPIVEKELLHYEIFYALDAEGLLDLLTLQGGTALRVCHGAPRFSEGLDFAGGRDVALESMRAAGDCVRRHIGRRFGLEVSVREPSESPDASGGSRAQVRTWRIAVATAPGRGDLPKQRLRIEIADVPAYSREVRPLRANYDFLPDGYSDTLAFVETPDEIMADKLVALASAGHVRHRDIWDLGWLARQGAVLKADWVLRKIEDYRIRGYPKKLQDLAGRLPDIIQSRAFRDEMTRFIPQDVLERTLLQSKFRAHLDAEVGGLLRQLQAEMGNPPA